MSEDEYTYVDLEQVDDSLAASPPPVWYDSEGHDDAERLDGVDISEEEEAS